MVFERFRWALSRFPNGDRQYVLPRRPFTTRVSPRGAHQDIPFLPECESGTIRTLPDPPHFLYICKGERVYMANPRCEPLYSSQANGDALVRRDKERLQSPFEVPSGLRLES
jgi:hypothetical protein